MRTLTRREAVVLVLVLSIAPAVILFRVWRSATESRGQAAAEPFRIAGNFYYVGASDASSFLITGPAGHMVLAGGYPSNAPLIVASIAKLGFDIKDVKALLNSEGLDGGPLAALQQASGAEVWASEANADAIASGGASSNMALPGKVLIQIGILGYPPARVDHRVKDGETVRVGATALTAHITSGSGPGCTSWSFQVPDGDRLLNVVSACGLGVTIGMRYAEQGADIEHSLVVLRSLHPDIWVTTRARAWGRYKKFVASRAAKNPVDAFVDPQGYRDFINSAEEDFRNGVVH